MLNWNPPAIDDQNGIVRYYVVNVTEVQTADVFEFTANATGLSISSLHPSYTYEIAVSATTIGQGPFSPALTLQTAEAGRINVEYLWFTVCIFDCLIFCLFVFTLLLQLRVAFLAISVHLW